MIAEKCQANRAGKYYYLGYESGAEAVSTCIYTHCKYKYFNYSLSPMLQEQQEHPNVERSKIWQT